MTPERALKCLLLVVDKHGKNQCPNDRLPGTVLCAHHLGEIAADFRRITQDALAEAGDGTD